jgi:hypothetical protein
MKSKLLEKETSEASVESEGGIERAIPFLSEQRHSGGLVNGISAGAATFLKGA